MYYRKMWGKRVKNGDKKKMNRNWEHCEEKPEKSGIDVIRK